jgi:hypothetical protein
MRVEGDGHHVGAEPHELDLLFDTRAGNAELHDRAALGQDRVVQPLPALLIHARHLPAVGLHRLFEGANPVDVRNGGAGANAVDVLAGHSFDVLLRGTKMIDRIGGSRVASDGNDQLFHGVSGLRFL